MSVGLGLPLVPKGYSADLLLVHPHKQDVFDAMSLQNVDRLVRVVMRAMGSEVCVPLNKVRSQVRQTLRHEQELGSKSAWLLADVYVQWALWHIDTPLGIRYRCLDPEAAQPPFVVFKGQFYDQRPDGALRVRGERDPLYPTVDDWFDAMEVGIQERRRRWASL